MPVRLHKHYPPPRLSEERARRLKGKIELPGVSEDDAQRIAANINSTLPESYGAKGSRYTVLNHYPSGLRYAALIRR